MNGIIANLHEKNPKVHAIVAGFPLCGRISVIELVKHELVCPNCKHVMLLKTERVKRPSLIQLDYGEVTCQRCIKRTKELSK